MRKKKKQIKKSDYRRKKRKGKIQKSKKETRESILGRKKE